MKRNTMIAIFVIAMIIAGTIAHAQDTTLAVTANGNVGIGTTKPLEKLHVEGGLYVNTAMGNLNIRHSGLGIGWKIGTLEFGRYLTFINVPSEGHGTNRVTFTQDGNVGIGTNSPGARLEVAGDAHISGKITSGSAKLSLPIAYGVIDRDGSVITATSNVYSTWNPSLQQYEISITGESYEIWDYVTTVTVLGGATPFMATTDSANGKLLVFVFDQSGTKTQERFHFIVFKP